MADPRTDDDLMLAYAGGDVSAFEVLYDRYRKPLFRYLLYATGDRAETDELFQDVWARIIDARGRFRRGAGFKRYAFRIARNRLVDHWRSLGRRPESVPEETAGLAGNERDGPEAETERGQLRDELMRALMQLPREQREAFLLQQEAGLTLAEIAARDGIGRETVKSRLRYAVNRLRAVLRPGAGMPSHE